MTTLHDVAVAAGVSDATVSRALRGVDNVRPSTRKKVEDIARSMNFTLSRSASALASGRSMRVSLLVSTPLNDWFAGNCLQGVYEVLAPEGYDVVPTVATNLDDVDHFFTDLPRSLRNMDGMIVPSFALGALEVDILDRANVPIVGLDVPEDANMKASVILDNRGGMREAIRYLLRLGHRHIGFVEHVHPSPFSSSSRQRGAFFMQEAAKLGVPEGDLSYFAPQPEDKDLPYDEAFAHMTTRILTADPGPTAVCVETDDEAINLIERMQALGVKVPEDISVIGFDDNARAAMADLTTIHQDPLRMAHIAASKLLTLMRGGQLSEPSTLFPVTLIPRGSSSSPKSRPKS